MARAPVPTVTSQRDFSAGEVDITVKRDDAHPLMKTGARQMANWRIRNSRGPCNRPGRRALFLESGRVEEVLLSPGNTFFLAFSNITLRVYNAAGAQVFIDAGRPWSAATVKNVVWVIADYSIYIGFPGAQPVVLTWDGVSTWSLASFNETVTAGGQKRTFFYRISPKNVIMAPAARTGTGIACLFSAGMNLVAGHVNTYMRFCGRQIKITAVASSTSATIDIIEPLPGSQVLTFASNPALVYAVGDPVLGSVSNAKGIITNINGGANQITVQLTSNITRTSPDTGQQGSFAFTTADIVVGPSGSLQPGAVAAIGNPQGVTIWDDEVMNGFRGWPSSLFYDQGRLGFCNFPAVPRAIGWSWQGLPNDLYIDGVTPTSAMLELVPEKGQAYFVAAGPDGAEFVFCDNGVWRIPISVTNPLVLGSVVFEPVTSDGCANVQPRKALEHLFYITAGQARVMAIRATGSYTHPHDTRDLTELRTHLFNAPIAIAVPSTEGAFPERHIYVLNADGTLAVGKFSTVDGQINVQGIVGWVPWTGGGTVKWIAALGADVIFTTTYAPNGITAVSVVEKLDASLYLDGGMAVNVIPTALTPPGGKGPFWWLPLGSVDLMDQTTRMMGTYQIDANGFIVPQGNAGENLAAATLVGGQAWAATLEPFVPAVQAGQDVSQRMWPRKIARAQVYVANSSGFVMKRLYAGQSGANLPTLGTVMEQRRFPAWNQGDDPTLPPPSREQSYLDRPRGRAHDPRWSVVKDTPGPLDVLEVSFEVTV